MNTDVPEPPKSAHETLQTRFKTICERESIGWQAERVFLRTLGVGGQGVVFLSERRGSAEFKLPLALKVFSPERYPDAASYLAEMQRLTRVATVVAKVQQDQVVTVQNVVSQGGLYLMEMEWIDGYDLQRLLRSDALTHIRRNVNDSTWQDINESVVTPGAEDSRFRPGTAVSVLRECLTGLAALHRAEIVHCDVKPSNIMVKRTGSVKLIDIGSAFLKGDLPPGNPCTPEYAAPEVLKGERATEQSDLASLGYVLIEMITGSHPFNGLTYAQLRRAKEEIPQKLAGMLPVEEFAFTEPLIVLLQKLIDPNPANRFKTAEEAETADDGASGFLRELVKSDLPDQYTRDLRMWMSGIDPIEDLSEDLHPSSSEVVPNGTTRMLDVKDMPLEEFGK
ncbi:MAG: serine/threonine-protein kinase [Planctomycetaceae bacterium]